MFKPIHFEVTTMQWVQNLLRIHFKESKFHMDSSIHMVFSFGFAKLQPMLPMEIQRILPQS